MMHPNTVDQSVFFFFSNVKRVPLGRVAVDVWRERCEANMLCMVKEKDEFRCSENN